MIYMSSSNGSLVTTIKPKAKQILCGWHVVLHSTKRPQQKLHIFFKFNYGTEFQDSTTVCPNSGGSIAPNS